MLENEEDMALMNLTKLHESPALYDPPLKPEILEAHEQFELLFEAYLQDVNSLNTELEIIHGNLTTVQELLLLRLDTARNQLLTATTIFSLVSMCAAIGSFVGSIFGTYALVFLVLYSLLSRAHIHLSRFLVPFPPFACRNEPHE